VNGETPDPTDGNQIDRLARIDKTMAAFRADESIEGLIVLRTQLARIAEHLDAAPLAEVAANGSRDQMIDILHGILVWDVSIKMLGGQTLNDT
jgi:hypothetical protein